VSRNVNSDWIRLIYFPAFQASGDFGAQAGSEVSAHLPGGSRTIRIIHIHQPQHVTPPDEIEDVSGAELFNVEPQAHTNHLPARREGQRRIEVEITQGMINQNLLVLTDAVNRGIVNVGETLALECMPSGERFSTEVIEQGKKLRERGAIGRFYAAARVRAGDCVKLSEVGPRRWRLERLSGASPSAQQDRLLF